ncbi:SIR2 family protein [Microbacterium sp. PRF11]|uniref:SIR2 family protein n=1 Tax=Microbacterium sp. PRF11 TaxID=2962593 RepID=UPI002882C9E1|nr:SIR2 family protein [Microbacterium sp. PRF11]MDT0116593.1 SIR2 family protein [Microbacterium sp. PRF11]
MVEALVRQVAAAEGEKIPEGTSPEEWWQSAHPGQELGYSRLLEELASTPAARRALLSTFFEPSEEDRANGLRVPGPAHRAIASLVARGSIRVIVTTNFDRLLEQALEAENVLPQVIVGSASAEGMEPLQHAKATVIKLHGDYASLEQRNTVEELREYPPAIKQLLARVVDEYGLIICGWSGEYDPALVEELDRSANRRYPLFWSSFEAPNHIARTMTARAGAHLIPSSTAETLFPDLLGRVEALAELAETPETTRVRLHRMKRVLADPVRHLEVRDIIADELERVEEWTHARTRERAAETDETYGVDLEAVAARTMPVMTLFSQGLFLDRDLQHTGLWRWVVERAMRMRQTPAFGSEPGLGDLEHYPAYLLLRAGILGALAAGHEAEVLSILGEPRWRSPLRHGGAALPAHGVLHEKVVLNTQAVTGLPRFAGRKVVLPLSTVTRAHLHQVAVELVGPAEAESLLDHMEFRMALAHRFLIPDDVDPFHIYQPVAGRFVWRPGESRINQPTLAVTAHFLRTQVEGPWRTVIGERFDEEVNKLDTDLRQQVRYI